MTSLLNHYYKYLEEYVQLTHDFYSKSAPAVFTDYYSLDKDNSIWDNNYVASYQDVGQLSGLVWRKISLFPVYFGEGAPPSLNASELGTTRKESIRPTVMVPRKGYVEPKIKDFIVFTNLQGESLVYEVINLDYSMPNDRAHFKLTLQPSHHTIESIENEVSERYVYNDVLDIIIPQNIGLPLLNFTTLFYELERKLINSFFSSSHDAFVEQYYIILDLNYYLIKLMSIFPLTKKQSYNIKQEDFYTLPSKENSVFNLLASSTYSYTDVLYKLDRAYNISSTLETRIKATASYEAYTISENGSYDYINIIYGNNSQEIKNGIEAFRNYMVTNAYSPLNSSLPLLKLFDSYVNFKETNTIEDNYSLLSNTLMEVIFELRYFKEVFEFAINNKVSGL